MLSKLLFGVQHSPFRTLCVALAVVVVVMGVAAIPILGWMWGVPVTVLGLLAVAVLSRQLAAYDEQRATSAQLASLSRDYDSENLRRIAEEAPHDPNAGMGRITDQIDGKEIAEAIDEIRGNEAAGSTG